MGKKKGTNYFETSVSKYSFLNWLYCPGWRGELMNQLWHFSFLQNPQMGGGSSEPYSSLTAFSLKTDSLVWILSPDAFSSSASSCHFPEYMWQACKIFPACQWSLPHLWGGPAALAVATVPLCHLAPVLSPGTAVHSPPHTTQIPGTGELRYQGTVALPLLNMRHHFKKCLFVQLAGVNSGTI